MKIDYDSNSTRLQNDLGEPLTSPGKTNDGAEESLEDKIIISDEARAVLSESADDVNTASELIEKVASAYPEKDMKLKINDIEIEATEAKSSNKLVSLIGSFLAKILK
jgi:hypothetical protein